MKVLDAKDWRGLFWEGRVVKVPAGSIHEYRVGFNTPPFYYLPAICHRDHACRLIVDYDDECFGWGYKGRGPKQLALSILVNTKAKQFKALWQIDTDTIALAVKHHVAFMEEVISKLPAEWELTEEFILDWLAKKEEAL